MSRKKKIINQNRYKTKILITYQFPIVKTKHTEPVVITYKQRASTCVLFDTFVTVL